MNTVEFRKVKTGLGTEYRLTDGFKTLSNLRQVKQYATAESADELIITEKTAQRSFKFRWLWSHAEWQKATF